MNNEQPWVDKWPMWDEPLSKIPPPFDVEAARQKLARKFKVTSRRIAARRTATRRRVMPRYATHRNV